MEIKNSATVNFECYTCYLAICSKLLAITRVQHFTEGVDDTAVLCSSHAVVGTLPTAGGGGVLRGRRELQRPMSKIVLNSCSPQGHELVPVQYYMCS